MSSLLKRADGFGTDFKGALSNSWVVFVAYAFVDDTDIIETQKYPTNTLDSVMGNIHGL